VHADLEHKRKTHNMRPLYIFDLDGTLALIQHRRHYVEGPTKDWDAFYAACVDDKPNAPMVQLLNDLLRSGFDIEVWIFSGRSDKVREETINWLVEHTLLVPEELEGPMLTMRRANDYTPDEVLKKQWLDGMLIEDRERLVCVFDDRDRVVKMWRAAGVTCLQVAEGDF